MTNISIHEGDITSAEVDAIVNAANPKMLGGGGVDGAIHKAAGPKLLEACRKVKSTNGIRCPVGESRITTAGQLKSNFVVHTVGPRYQFDEDPQNKLAASYHSALQLAIDNGCSSIAFPAISCGAYGYPLNEAAKIAITQCKLPEFASLQISFYLYGKNTYQAWEQALNK